MNNTLGTIVSDNYDENDAFWEVVKTTLLQMMIILRSSGMIASHCQYTKVHSQWVLRILWQHIMYHHALIIRQMRNCT